MSTPVMKVEMVTVGKDEAGMRLDRWFKEHYPGLGFGHLQKLLRSGQVRLDGGRVKADNRVQPGQVVRVPPLNTGDGGPAMFDASGAPMARPKQVASANEADYLRSLLLYEDEHVFVFNKPAGLAVQGGSGMTRHIDGMLEALRDRKGVKPRLVHRLDRETSGCLLVARTRLAASTLARTFQTRSARKIYWALVYSVPKPRQGKISSYLKKEATPDGEMMRVARHGEKDAQHAVTYYSTVEAVAQKFAWLTLKPVTGRTHQLRVHLQSIGHPIIGDPRYFDIENYEFPGGIQNRLHLLARRLTIPHPAGGGSIDVTAPLPPHMLQSWNSFGLDIEDLDKADPKFPED
ncbi:Ribosomal large subunit pseudouridine synthase C [Hartmannibacter diazotrophicus]|uniref:Pseudouridine synthase n=1 Tax=Hartmannibacter diazotrophicus TaxID=1482074 RepID=A0A2C9D5J9_9HYPH|nr:RluA family pseudouridine synthase [Hartmannibacter diazotrophicus]SON55470.1 Ribosomal large subunit pseudouridine synthase C [Hartmannibacter diazotrophicus]